MDEENQNEFMVAKSVKGAIIGQSAGELVASNDDPQPEVSIAPIGDKVTDGQSLTYRVSRSMVAKPIISALCAFSSTNHGDSLR